jgi:hypothetical protein
VTLSCCGRLEGETRRRLREGGEEKVESRGGARGSWTDVLKLEERLERLLAIPTREWEERELLISWSLLSLILLPSLVVLVGRLVGRAQ